LESLIAESVGVGDAFVLIEGPLALQETPHRLDQ
jgi:hypothetical protein